MGDVTYIGSAPTAPARMQNGRPSITAQRVALRRAAHQILDFPRVFDDPLALSILGAEDAANLAINPQMAGDPGSRFIRAFMAARSRYAEDQLSASINSGVTQFAILGAGLDTFAYRNPYPSSKLRVFEVDHPATQSWKRARLASEGIVVPQSLTFVPIDFEKQALSSGLELAGFQMNEPTFFSWLGVTPYLTCEAFESTLHLISSMPSGSGVTFDYAVSRSSLNSIEKAALEALSTRVASAGEPFQLFFEKQFLAAQLEQFGFHRIEDLGSEQINQRYFAGRSDRLQVIGGLARLISAYV